MQHDQGMDNFISNDASSVCPASDRMMENNEDQSHRSIESEVIVEQLTKDCTPHPIVEYSIIQPEVFSPPPES